jgi:outer membrane protein OmpA-like peptidoglycan-associated protein
LRKAIIHGLAGLALFACPFLSFGQDFLPALNDNFMGINQAFLQPAAIADSRFKSDFNVGGFSNDIYNDAIRFRSKWILDPTSILTNEDWWDENTYISGANGKDKSVFVSQSAIGPSFLATLSPKHSIGFTSRVRSILNIDGMDEPLFRLIYSNYQADEYYNKWYQDQDMRTTQHVFGDYGLTYARVIPLNQEEHFLKAGITVKLLQGIASSYLQTEDLYYYFNGEAYPGAKNISLNSTYVHGGLSDNWGDTNQYGSYTFSMNYQLTAKPSVGMDLGVVYEFRRDMIKDGTDRSGRPDKNKYFVKVGLSLLDIGRLKYKKDYYSSDYIAAFTPDYLNRYNTSDNSVPDDTYWLDANEVHYSFRDYPDFSYAMHQRSVNGEGLQKATSNKEYFTVRLPSAISLQVDVNLFLEGLYVNLTTYHALNQGYSNVPNSHYISTYSITPRYEQKWYGVSVPVVINQYGKLDVGLGVRAGVVYFGVNNLFSNVFSDPYGIHGYVGVKVPIHQKDPTKPPKEPKKEKALAQAADNNSNCKCCCTPVYILCCGQNAGYVLLPDSLYKAMSSICSDSTFNADSICRAPLIFAGTIPLVINPGIVQHNIPSEPKSAPGMGQAEATSPPPSTPEPTTGKPTSPSIPEPPLVSRIGFKTAESALSASDKALLDQYASKLKSAPGKKLRIAGYTDNVGTEQSNMDLSLKRAESTARYLINKGVSPGQLLLESYGESEPVDNNITPEGRQNNRRVEMELIE